MPGIAATRVQTQMDVANNHANAAISAAEDALSDLANVGYTYLLGVNYKIDDFVPPTLSQPSAPADLTMPPDPALVAVGTVEKPTRPTITLPSVPPVVDFAIPDAPGITIPTMGNVVLDSLLNPSTPNAPIIDIDDFVAREPSPIEISPPSWDFPVDRIPLYDDELVAATITRLKSNIVDGGTGLSEAVENDIWNRGLERENQQLQDSTDKVVQMWAKKGFSLPDGLLAHSLSELQVENFNKRIDRAREISIKQAELEQENLFKSMTQGVSLFGELVKGGLGYGELVFRSQEGIAKFANEFIQLQIAAHNSAVEVFKAKAQIYESVIRGQLAKVEVYKAQIESEISKVQMNEQTVKVFMARIQAEVEKFKGSLEGSKLIVEIFSEEVRAVLAKAQIEESKIKVYAETVRGVLANVDIYKADVQAMAEEINAEKLKVDTNLAIIQQWSEKVRANLTKYTAAVEFFKAQSSFNISSADVTNKILEANIRTQVEAARIKVMEAEAVVRSIESANSTRLEAMKGVATATATMAAGAMAAVSASAKMEYNEEQPLQVIAP